MAIGALYLYFAFQIRETSLADATGPAGLPKAYGVLMIVLGAILSLQAAFSRPPTGEAAPSASEDIGRILRAAGLLAIGIGYILVVPYTGYLLSITALIIAVAAYQGIPFSPRLLGIGAGGAAALWVTFVWLLGIPMPSGWLGTLLS